MPEKASVARDTMVSIEYTLTDAAGEVMDSNVGGEPLTYLHGHEQILPAIEHAIEGRSEGDSRTFAVKAADGFGEHDPEKVVVVPRERFEFKPEVGQTLGAQLPGGGTVPFHVSAVDDQGVTLDGNHPLAGKDMTFEVRVVKVRPATADEISKAAKN
jgi:FKBP-type peptidyl-prolyl cis-trans isomerase SlyD